MTTAQLAPYIGQTGILTTATEGLHVRVRIVDAKLAYGRVLVSIVPVDGNPKAGAPFIELKRLTLDGKK